MVRDAYGNDRMWSPSPPTIALTATGLSELRGSTVQNPDGTYLVNYFISQKTTYTMSVTFDGERITTLDRERGKVGEGSRRAGRGVQTAASSS